MDIDKKYFNKISNRERALFEGAITMGALFHQFTGTPVSPGSVQSLEKSIKTAMELQPCIEKVEIEIDRKMLEEAVGEFDYLSLSGDMMKVKVFSKYEDKSAVLMIEYIPELRYPLMYVKEIDE